LLPLRLCTSWYCVPQPSWVKNSMLGQWSCTCLCTAPKLGWNGGGVSGKEAQITWMMQGAFPVPLIPVFLVFLYTQWKHYNIDLISEQIDWKSFFFFYKTENKKKKECPHLPVHYKKIDTSETVYLIKPYIPNARKIY
jgi:hypothetical protein